MDSDEIKLELILDSSFEVADLLHKEIKDQLLKKIYTTNQLIHKAKGVIKQCFTFSQRISPSNERQSF